MKGISPRGDIKIKIKALGQTIKIKGDVSLVFQGDLPDNCMVLFVSKETWAEIKNEVEIE